MGAPLTAFLEYRDQTLSSRFDLPTELIYFTCAIQLGCAIGILLRPFAFWSAGALTVITIGAIASHVRIGSPESAVVAVFYTALQIWFALKVRRRDQP